MLLVTVRPCVLLVQPGAIGFVAEHSFPVQPGVRVRGRWRDLWLFGTVLYALYCVVVSACWSSRSSPTWKCTLPALHSFPHPTGCTNGVCCLYRHLLVCVVLYNCCAVLQ